MSIQQLITKVTRLRASRRAILQAVARSTDATEEYRQRYFNDPVGFARDVLRIKLWSRQREIAEAVAHNKQVAVRSGHKTGKSTLIVVLALWWVCTRRNGTVVLTSASGRQVRGILWKELRRVYRRVRHRIGGRLHKVPDRGLQFDDGREIIGFSTDEPERMAGISGAELLFMPDEASGVDDEIFEAIEGNRAGDDGDEPPDDGQPASEARIAMFSNPTRTSGTFFEAFHAHAASWVRIQVSSEEAAAVTPRIRGLATKAYVEKKRREWGAASPLYQVRVLGDFPTQGDRSVVPLALVTEAVKRWPDTPAQGLLEIGVDVARYGDDDSVIQAGRGNKAFEAEVIHGQDTVEIFGAVLKTIDAHRADPKERVRIKVDVIGVGAGVFDMLRHHAIEVRARGEQIEVIPVNVAEKAPDEKSYPLLRDQIWFSITAWLSEGGAIPPNGMLEGELVAPEYSFDLKGRQKVQSKDEIKAKLKRSPDEADALGLMIFSPPSRGEVTAPPDVDIGGRFEGGGRGF